MNHLLQYSSQPAPLEHLEIEIRNYPFTMPLQAVMWAVCVGYLETYRILRVRDIHGCTPLLLAAAHGHNDCLEFLIQERANLTLKTGSNQTALHLAVRSGDHPSVTTLIRAGLHVDSRDSDGLSALTYAGCINSVPVAKALLEAGATIRPCDFPPPHGSGDGEGEVNACFNLLTHAYAKQLTPEQSRRQP